MARVSASLRRLGLTTAFVTLSSVIVVITSEKFYWYPQGFPRLDNFELVVAYAIGMLSFFAVSQRFGTGGLPSVIIATFAFALVVEGVVTPVVYEDGPFPALALYFFGWHGLLSCSVGWYGIRRLALDRRRWTLAAISIGYGLIVGLWSTIYWLPSQVQEMREIGNRPDDIGQWSIDRFGAYSVLLTAILIGAHWLLGRVWVDDWRIGRRGSRLLTAIVVAGVVMWTFAVPFAPIKFGLLAWLTIWLLRRTRPDDDRSVDEPTLFASLSGRVRLVDLAPVALVVPTATGVYAAMTAIDPSDAVLDAVYGGVVAATLLGGVVVGGWAIRRRRPASREVDEQVQRAQDRVG